MQPQIATFTAAIYRVKIMVILLYFTEKFCILTLLFQHNHTDAKTAGKCYE